MWCKACNYGSMVAVMNKCPQCHNMVITNTNPYVKRDTNFDVDYTPKDNSHSKTILRKIVRQHNEE